MDIVRILDEHAGELFPEDLDFFETELATGEVYDADYKAACKAKITEIRAWMNSEPAEETPPAQPEPAEKNGNVVIGIRNLAPDFADPAGADMTPARQIEHDIKVLREKNNYKTAFKDYVKDCTLIDAAFLEAHLSFFQPWELDAIVSVKQLGEEFLEKYFSALDHDKIARYQLFSEGFFMKHFSQLDASVVLEHGKNAWRKKENRSKQLDVFLRLKGVKI